MKKIFFIAALAITICSCNAIKGINCRSKSTVPVVFITKSGMFYTVDVPYCDTIALSSDQLPPPTVKLQTVKQ